MEENLNSNSDWTVPVSSNNSMFGLEFWQSGDVQTVLFRWEYTFSFWASSWFCEVDGWICEDTCWSSLGSGCFCGKEQYCSCWLLLKGGRFCGEQTIKGGVEFLILSLKYSSSGCVDFGKILKSWSLILYSSPCREVLEK